ncbi:MAG: PAS domain S-box protein [Hydrogenophaga sp.]|nr:PAS domain S-box protein [Hydrogenophaga sp.]
MGWLIHSPEMLVRASIVKGWFFVGVTTLLLFVLVRQLIGQLNASHRRERAEAEAKERTMQLLTAIAKSSSDAIFAKDEQGRYLLVNETAARYMGKPVDELLGRDDLSAFPAEQAEAIMSIDRRVFASRQPETNEERLMTALGERVFLTTRGPLRDVSGRTMGTLGISRDITARKDAERRLFESESRYRSLFENMNTGFVLFEVVVDEHRTPSDLVIVAANQRFALISGVPVEQTIGRRLTEVLPGIESDQADWIGTYGRVALSGEARQFERGSEKLGVHFSVSAFRAGENLCAVTFLDVTERIKTEQALRDSEERLRLALAAASQGLYDLNLETGEAAVSPEYARMLGHEPAGFRETLETWTQRLHPEDREKVLGTLNDYLAGRVSAYRVEFRLRTKDGDWKWILSMGQIQQRSADGQPKRMLGTHTDIDALKLAESRLREINATLEARVAERTSALSAANVELETFAYAVSHDLRAPLRALSGYSQALEEDFGGALPDQARAYLDRIHQSVARMGELIEGLLALSRSTRGKLRHDSVDISALARQRLTQLSEETGRTVASEVDDGVVVFGDERMLSSVLTNLIDNAWKYTGATQEPRIRVQASSADDGMTGFCVSDNGAGFDMSHADRLFKPFQRLHRDDQFPGIGIGLATVQRIVQRHGGQISVLAAPGEGATFCVVLPKASAW